MKLHNTQDLLWDKEDEGHELAIVPLRPDNMEAAKHILSQQFPSEVEAAVQSLETSRRWPNQINLPGAENLNSLNYYVLYVDGVPAGVTGYYSYKDAPREAWLGRTALSYIFRGRRPDLSPVLLNFITEKVRQTGHFRFYSRSVQNPSHSSDELHNMLQQTGWQKQVLNQPHQGSEIHIYGRAINGLYNPLSETNLRMGSEAVQTPHPTSQVFLELQKAEAEYAEIKRQRLERATSFRARFKDAETYVKDGRFMDLTGGIYHQVHNPYTDSFNVLNERLFPIVQKREVVFGEDGLRLYVQPDKDIRFAASERRIFGILNEDRTEVIAAIVYNIASFPTSLRHQHNVDGTLGITYLMTHEDYSANGLGAVLIQKAQEQSKQFLAKMLGLQHCNIIMMTEQNDPMTMSLRAYIDDFAGARMGTTERQRFWGYFGQRNIEGFHYTQSSLRPGLPEIDLALHIRMPGNETTIPSGLLKYMVLSYASRALNKQMASDITTLPGPARMDSDLSELRDFLLAAPVREYAQGDSHIRAAVKYELSKPNPRMDVSVGQLITEYDDAVAHASLQCPTPLRSIPKGSPLQATCIPK